MSQTIMENEPTNCRLSVARRVSARWRLVRLMEGGNFGINVKGRNAYTGEEKHGGAPRVQWACG